MPWKRPTLPQLIARSQADIETELPGTDPRLRRSALGVLARAVSGLIHGLYGYLAWAARQIIPDTADREILIRHADWWGVALKQAAPAGGLVEAAGADGSVIPAGTVWRRGDGIEYAADAEAVIAGRSATVPVTAVLAGGEGNAAAGVALTLTTPLSGIQGQATVAPEGLVGGADIENTDSLRDRFRRRVQAPPHGGNWADYERWALETPGVTRAWVMPLWSGLGTVGVFVVRDHDEDMIPRAAAIAEVQDYIDEVRPVTADVTVYAPAPVAIDLTIQLQPNTEAVRQAVLADLADLFSRAAEVEDGTGSGTIRISHLRAAISLAEGEEDHALSLTEDVAVQPGEIGVLGAVTFEAL